MIHLSCFSQSIVSETDSNNELSIYLKKNVSKKLLKKVSYPYGKSFISASFCIDKNNEIYNFTTSNIYSELNDALKEAFKNYPIEKLVPTNRSQSAKYNLKIIAKKGSKNIFDCSNHFTVETSYLSRNCQKFEQYPDRMKCFSEEVKDFFLHNMNSQLLTTKYGSSIIIDFKVTKRGKLVPKSKNNKSPRSKEIDRILKLYPATVIPASLNAKPIAGFGQFRINLSEAKDKNTTSFASLVTNMGNPPMSNIQKYSKPNTTNDLSLFIKEHLSKELLSKANLNAINNSIILRFNIDSKKGYFNITTNARSSSVEDALISIFKEYPLEGLDIQHNNTLTRYAAQLLSFESGANIVNASSEILYESLPIYRGCENSKSIEEAKKCFSSKLSSHLRKKFDFGLISTLEIPPGQHRIVSNFKFSKDGEVIDIRVKAPHDDLKEETIRVIKTIPKLASPAIQNGKPVSVLYTLPISFKISAESTSSATKSTNFKPGNVNF